MTAKARDIAIIVLNWSILLLCTLFIVGFPACRKSGRWIDLAGKKADNRALLAQLDDSYFGVSPKLQFVITIGKWTEMDPPCILKIEQGSFLCEQYRYLINFPGWLAQAVCCGAVALFSHFAVRAALLRKRSRDSAD